MPPIFVDGVEIKSVFVDGVEQQTVFADGVEVFTAFEPEDYLDTFQGAGQTRNVAMDSGQFWSITRAIPTQPVHQAGVWGAVGFRVSNIHNENGATVEHELSPIVAIINESFVASASFSWSPPAAISNQASVRLDSALNTYINVNGLFGNYETSFVVNGVTIDTVAIPFIDVNQATMVLYYDGTDIAATITARDSIGGVFNHTFPQRSADGAVTVDGRKYVCVLLPAFAFIFSDCEIYEVNEVGIPPASIPWPT